MRASIFAEGSSTTLDDPGDVKMQDYFQGTFLPVATLIAKLREYGSLDVHILSDEFGYVHGEDKVSECDLVDEGEKPELRMRESLLEAARNSEVVGVFLTDASFNEIVLPIRDEMIERARPKSIWCFGLSQGALKLLELERLVQKGCEVIPYHRIGVAPIGTDEREELLSLVESRYAPNE
jgi:hypothetical protein